MGERRGGRVINYKALEGRRRPTTGGCAARRMCKGMIMPNGEILPTGPGITWTRARPCSNLFDRVSYFSARPRPPRKKIICSLPRCDAAPPAASRRCTQVLLTSSSRRGGGRENGSRENTGGLMVPDTRGRDFHRVPGNLINPRSDPRSFRLFAERLLTCRGKI